jgi:hypothetical protein
LPPKREGYNLQVENQEGGEVSLEKKQEERRHKEGVRNCLMDEFFTFWAVVSTFLFLCF